MNMVSRILALLMSLCLFLSLHTPLVYAEDEVTQETVESLEDYLASLDGVEKNLKLPSPSNSLLDEIGATTEDAVQYSNSCIKNAEQEQDKLGKTLESFGKPSPGEDLVIQRSRRDLEKQKADIDKQISQCRLLNLRATNLKNQIRDSKQTLLKETLFTPNKSILTYIINTIQQPTLWATESQQLFNTLTSLPFNINNIRQAFLYGLAGFFAGLAWSQYKRYQYKKEYKGLIETSPTLETVWRSIIKAMPSILMFGLVSLSFYFKPSGVAAINELVATLLVFTISYAILRAILRPSAKALKVGDLVAPFPETSKKLYFWARLFLFATLFAALFYSPLLNTNPESSLVGLIRITLGTLSSFALLHLVWLLGPSLPWIRQYKLHIAGTLVILVAIIALWMGYRNFSNFLFTGTFGSLFLLLIGWLLMRIPTEIFDGMDEGTAGWQRTLRAQLGLADGEMVPGLVWLRLLVFAIVFITIAALMLLLWGMSAQALKGMFTQISKGITIGSFTFEPVRLLAGFVTIALLIGLTHLLKNNLANNWLNRTNLSRGAREATITIAGYAGILLAIFVGLSVAGIKFTNLAIIAGALSVGIGFGLQNIVNNFISGIILLFERPIRRGDWIRVGTSEGYVRDISIRSTVIQTFDRSDIIVPNSELISNQVTNMMLNNQYGRIIIAIGVAYGSDVDLVMKTLYNVAAKHPMVLREQGELKIQVFFRSFGESSLNFELRCQIRDVEKQLVVTSELNVAIERAFRDQNIEIPFPQRIVRFVADDPNLAAAIPTGKMKDLG